MFFVINIFCYTFMFLLFMFFFVINYFRYNCVFVISVLFLYAFAIFIFVLNVLLCAVCNTFFVM